MSVFRCSGDGLHAADREGPKMGAAPVNEKRIGLSRSHLC